MSVPKPSQRHASPASIARRAHARDALRTTILAAAAELFVAEGYEGLTMRQLGAKIGYAAPTIYLYFANKEDLLFNLLDEGYRELGKRLATAAADQDEPIARLEALGRTYIAFGQAYPQHYQLMFMRRTDFLQARLAARPESSDAFAILEQAVGQAIEAGALIRRDPRALSLALWSTVHGLVGLLFVGPPLPEPHHAAIIDTTITALLNGLCTRPNPPS